MAAVARSARARASGLLLEITRATLALASMFYGSATLAYPGGITGYSNDPATYASYCTSCHTGSTYSGYSASFTASSTVAPSTGTSVTFNLTYGSGTAAPYGGLDVSAQSGSFTAGTGSRVSSTTVNHTDPDLGAFTDSFDGELVHSAPKATSGGSASWTFTYTTPSSVGTVTLYGCGNPVAYDQDPSDDGPARCATKTITVNSTPNAVNDSPSVNKNSSSNTLSVLSNDTSGSSGNETGDSITITSVGATNHGGSVSRINGNTQLSYSPAAGYSGTETFTYTITDSIGATDTATVTVTVVNHAPAATADSYSTNEDTALVKNAATGVLANDTDSDGDTLTAVKDTDPTHGTLTLNSNGSFTYTPTANYNGSDSFTYHATDGTASSSIVTVSITVVAVNDPPVGNADSYSTNENTALVVAAGSGVLANDTDVENDPLTAAKIGNPSHGTVTLNSNGSFTYTPTNTYYGSDSFTYQANDGNANSSTTTVTITVNQVAPTGAADSYSASENTTLTVTAGSGVLANDTDPSGTPTATKIGNPSHGSVSLSSDGSFSYTPTTHYFGSDSFTYQSCHVSLCSSTTTVSLTVNQGAPTVTGDSYSIAQNTTLTANAASGVLANDSDPSNLSITASLVGNVSHGSLTLNSDGSFTYTPTNGYFGADSFTYTASNGTLTSSTATVSLAVGQSPPTGVADSYSVAENGTLTVNAASGVLINDTDPSSQTLSATNYSTPSHGTLSGNSNGSFTYTPAAHYFGTDTFTYQATNTSLLSSSATTVTITIPQGAPIANNDSYSVSENATLTVSCCSGVLGNDTDPSNLTLTPSVVASPSHGSLTLNSNGSFVYTPNTAYYGSDSFTYHDSNGTLTSNTATVTITINQGAPTANADSYSVNENATLTVTAGSGVLANDTDPSNLTLTASVFSVPSHGSLTLNSNGSFTYTPTTGYFGTDSFSYKASNGTLSSSAATVSITISQQPPTANADSYSVNENASLTVTAGSGVLANDTDPSSLPLTASLISGPSHGSLTLNSNGSFTYTPTTGYFGSDSFSYRASNGTLNSGTATVTLNVSQQPPTASADSYTGTENITLTVSAPGVLANDTDPSSLALTATLISGPSHGSLTLNSDGSFTYTPSANYYGSDSFSYKADNGTLTSNTATVSLTVLNAPSVTPPADISMSSTGYLTYVALGTATATDPQDGTLKPTADAASGFYRPGHYVVTYSAINAANVTSTATQNVDVIPLVEAGADQISGAGRTVQLDVRLNGNAVSYPVSVSYTIDGAVGGGSVSIVSGTGTTIPVVIPADSGSAPDRTITLTLTMATNAVLDTRRVAKITVVDRNVAPVVSLGATQQSQPRTLLLQDQGNVSISANATDPNTGDTLSYDWTGTDAAMSPPAAGGTSQFNVDPSTLSVGTHSVQVTVTDNVGASTTRNLLLVVRATAPVFVPSVDTDGDGIADTVEGVADTAGNGMPAYLDPYSDAFALPTQTSNPATETQLEADAGLQLRLGSTALAAGRNGALIQYGDLGSSGSDANVNNVGGLFDFQVSGIDNGGSAQIVLPLQTALRSGVTFREYSAGGGWHNFTSDANDSISSALAVNGTCPGPNSTSWIAGLRPFAQCVRLTIQDGGPNDADGLVNGVIDNTGGVTIHAAQSASSGAASSGGAFAPAMLAALAAAAGLRRRRSAKGDRQCRR